MNFGDEYFILARGKYTRHYTALKLYNILSSSSLEISININRLNSLEDEINYETNSNKHNIVHIIFFIVE